MQFPALNPPSSPTLAALERLLAPLATTAGAWSLDSVHYAGALILLFSHPSDRLELRLTPATATEPALHTTAYFRLSHSGAASADALRLLTTIAKAIRHTEPTLTHEQRQALCSPPSSPTALDQPNLLGSDLELRITQRCNEACPFCSAKGYSENRLFTPEAILDAIAQAPSLSARRIVFSGGEPTLVPQLPRFIAAAHAAGLDAVLQTNGLVPSSPAWWSHILADYGPTALPDSIFLSMHTQYHSRTALLTGVPETLHRKLATARIAHSLGLKVVINLVVTRLNLAELHDFPRFLTARLGRWPELVISIAAPVGAAEKDPSLLVSLTELRPHLRTALLSAVRRGLSAQVAEACGVPMCILPDLAPYFAASLRPLSPAPLSPDRTKSPLCAQCAQTHRCIGIWQSYATHYGLSELTPMLA